MDRIHLSQWLVILCLGMGSLGNPSLAQAQAVDQVPRFEKSECPMSVTDGIECGYLLVPEDRQSQETGTIRVAVAIAHSFADQPKRDPVVYLHGGPSSSLLWRSAWWAWSPFRADRDVILIDQRGSGFSKPSLDCPEMDEIPVETLTQGIDVEMAAANHATYALQCRDRLRAAGIRLEAYTNADIAADVEDLRRLLGYKQWNLFAWSAGTRVALTILRDHPQGIRSVILDSIYMPPSVDFYAELMPNAVGTFQMLFDACTADANCASTYPDLRGLFLHTVDKLNDNPLTFDVEHPFTGERYRARMNGAAFVGLIYRLLYNAADLRILPKLIHDVYDGSTGLLPQLLVDPLIEPDRYFVGLNQSIHCSDEAPFTSNQAIAHAKASLDPRFDGFYHWDVDVRAFMQFCAQWGTRSPDQRENQPVVSSVPALIFAGTFDPASPPAHGKIAAQTLSNSYFFEFPTLSHFVWVSGGTCPQQIAHDFLDNPTAAPNAECITQMRPLQFEVGAEPPLIRNVMQQPMVRILLIISVGAGIIVIALSGLICWQRYRRK
ncbi:MAG: alpha/beta fold hydrolase [Anaerolineae bacterium]|nr:alpha/beta fold hydrolase [Anaerolineae bacterium]